MLAPPHYASLASAGLEVGWRGEVLLPSEWPCYFWMGLVPSRVLSSLLPSLPALTPERQGGNHRVAVSVVAGQAACWQGGWVLSSPLAPPSSPRIAVLMGLTASFLSSPPLTPRSGCRLEETLLYAPGVERYCTGGG